MLPAETALLAGIFLVVKVLGLALLLNPGVFVKRPAGLPADVSRFEVRLAGLVCVAGAAYGLFRIASRLAG